MSIPPKVFAGTLDGPWQQGSGQVVVVRTTDGGLAYLYAAGAMTAAYSFASHQLRKTFMELYFHSHTTVVPTPPDPAKVYSYVVMRRGTGKVPPPGPGPDAPLLEALHVLIAGHSQIVGGLTALLPDEEPQCDPDGKG